ncbi:MAG: ribonuclease HII [Patescibacteria group bacterium]
MALQIKTNRQKIIVGIDEVGRGPLAGPITIGAIVMGPLISEKKLLKNIKDSKKLTAKQREKWFKILKENFECKTASINSKTIDKIGIQKAAGLGAARVLQKITGHPMSNVRTSDVLILLDGLLKAPRHYKQKTIIKGDEKIPVISAASIIAKVTRDRKMLYLHKKYPQYGFNQHKGYGTKHHYKMLKKHGSCEIHRKSFRLTNNIKSI